MNKTKLSTVLNRILFGLILFLLGFIILYPKFPLFNIKGTFVAVRVEDFLIAATIVIWMVYQYIKKDFTFFTKGTIGKALLLFFLTGIFSLFSAYFLTFTSTTNLAILHFLRRVELIALLPICATIVTTKKRLSTVLLVLVFTLLAVNIYALGQQYFDWPVISTTNSEFSKGLILRLTPGARVNSTFAGHYDLAVFLAVALVFLSALLFAVRNSLKFVLLGLSALTLFVLTLTAARISFAAAFLGLIFSLIFARRKKYLILLALLLGISLVYPSQLRDRFISTITINILNMGNRYEGRNNNQRLENKLNIPTLAYRMASRSADVSTFATPSGALPTDIAPGEPTNVTELGVYRSFQIRLNTEWPMALRAFYKNPFFGTGYASLGLATDNDFLRSLGETGILGTAAFFLLLLAIWKEIFKGLGQHNKFIRYFSAGTLSAIIVFLANGLFIDVFEASKVASLFWMILGINLAVLRNE
ncbi:MAG: O-antigen ligase family protein [Candidatus Daviesbacteria bacterium]|nr:O-antigen ligase family protein [Candidatus Daviesbacteria bacterium]